MSLRMSDDANEDLLQERLRILLHRLRWSYVNLWTFNPRTRVLEWTRGHFEVVYAKAGAREYAQLFYTTFKPCCCTRGLGAVGQANLEGKSIWLTGDAICHHAGSVEQSQFLECAQIKTTMCVPWVDSVLEIGTINVVAENVALTDRIQQVLANDLLSLPPVTEHVSTHTSSAMFPGFHQDASPTNLALHQAWRSSKHLSLSLNSAISDLQPTTHPDVTEESLAFGQDMQTQGHSEAPAAEIGGNQAVNLNLPSMTDQYSSLWSGGVGTSTSIEGEGSSGRTYSVSPELPQQFDASPLFSALERTPTSGTLHSPFPGPRNLNQIRRTNSCGDQYEIRKYHTLGEAQELHHQWRQQLSHASELPASTACEPASNSPSGPSHLPFPGSWSREVSSSSQSVQILNPAGEPSKRPSSVARSNVKLMNQVSKIAGPLLRGQSLSALELLKIVDKHRVEAAVAAAAEAGFRGKPGDATPAHGMREPQGPTQGQVDRSTYQRSMGVELVSSSGSVHVGHGEAAANHMLAERRRRSKQKENFMILRRLVPIISKADKASTLVDTITYLKLLQIQIQELEASKEDIDRQRAILESKCKGLHDRNQELVELLAKDQPNGAIHLNLVHLNLKSMNSS